MLTTVAQYEAALKVVGAHSSPSLYTLMPHCAAYINCAVLIGQVN